MDGGGAGEEDGGRGRAKSEEGSSGARWEDEREERRGEDILVVGGCQMCSKSNEIWVLKAARFAQARPRNLFFFYSENTEKSGNGRGERKWIKMGSLT